MRGDASAWGHVQRGFIFPILLALCRCCDDTHLAGVDLAPVATPLALDAPRLGAAFGKAAQIEGDDALGFTP